MQIEKVDVTKRDKLRRALETNLSSYNKRGISFVIQAHSGYVGTVTILVSGKRGIAQKNLTIVFNEAIQQWEIIADGYIARIDTISEIKTIVKSKIQKLSTLLVKF